LISADGLHLWILIGNTNQHHRFAFLKRRGRCDNQKDFLASFGGGRGTNIKNGTACSIDIRKD
jgi:hypothetical protein